jgi:hypothetical protein
MIEQLIKKYEEKSEELKDEAFNIKLINSILEEGNN